MERLLTGLTDAQRRAVVSPAQSLRIIAGAGSGKTRVLTHRMAHQAEIGALEPGRTLALTFTRQAAGELGRRMWHLGLRERVAAGTFHAQAWAQLNAAWADRDVKPPALLTRRGRIFGRLLPETLDRNARSLVVAELDWARARRIAPEHYAAAADAAGRRSPLAPHQMVQLMDDYRAEKNRRRVVDFEDLLELCIRDLQAPDYAAGVHWRFRHLFVDEFQDVNPLQFALLKAWLGPDVSLCVVGDPRQAIYGWNGADPQLLRTLEDHFPETETVELLDNFRSTPQILRSAASILSDETPLRPTRPNGPVPTVLACADDIAEGRRIARSARDAHAPGDRWRDQAVLVRTNAQVPTIVEALEAAGIPTSQRQSVNILHLDRVAEVLLGLPRRCPTLKAAATELRMEPTPQDDTETLDAFGVLADMADEHLTLDPESTTAAFIDWVSATVVAADHQRGDAIQVLTFHAAKGLEWPTVHLAGLEQGLVPISRASSEEALAEERRLLYVAVTRAQRQLHCTWSAERHFGKRVVKRRPSPFLDMLLLHQDDVAPTVERTENLKHIRSIRAQLDQVLAEPEPPDPLDVQLRSWRAEVARAANTAAFVVFGDRTLNAIVTRVPRDLDALAEIPGIGPVKLQRYGEDILAIIERHEGDVVDLRNHANT